MLLKAENIKKKFNKENVLKDISLEVKKGEVVAIIRDHPAPVNPHYFAV